MVIYVTKWQNRDMTKLTDIATYLGKENWDMTFITNPTTVNYLTGFAMDPHERILGLMIFHTSSAILALPVFSVSPPMSIPRIIRSGETGI